MRSLLVKQDLVVVIDGKAKKLAAMKDEKWDKTDEKKKLQKKILYQKMFYLMFTTNLRPTKFGINFKVCTN